jgi:hypothetical protein
MWMHLYLIGLLLRQRAKACQQKKRRVHRSILLRSEPFAIRHVAMLDIFRKFERIFFPSRVKIDSG